MAAHEIVKEENFGITAVFDHVGRFKNVNVQTAADKEYRQKNRRNQEKCLQAISYNDGF
jgi:hypothetical protein